MLFRSNRVLKQQRKMPELKNQNYPENDEQIAAAACVAEVMDSDISMVRETDILRYVFQVFAETDFVTCPVVNSHGKLVGIIRMDSLRPILLNQQDWEWIIAGDMCHPINTAPYPSSTLAKAFDLMRENQLREIPVVEPQTSRVVGLLRYEKMERYIREEWLEIKKNTSAGHTSGQYTEKKE